jgi:hypothetical protein
MIGLILGIVGAVVVVGGCLVCGVGGYAGWAWGRGVVEQQVKSQLSNHPRVVEKIGTIQEFEFGLMDSAEASQSGPQLFVFNVAGSKGSGVIRVQMDRSGRTQKILYAELEISPRETYVLIGEGAEEEEATQEEMADPEPAPAVPSEKP